jgi:hypothetical protein
MIVKTPRHCGNCKRYMATDIWDSEANEGAYPTDVKYKYWEVYPRLWREPGKPRTYEKAFCTKACKEQFTRNHLKGMEIIV